MQECNACLKDASVAGSTVFGVNEYWIVEFLRRRFNKKLSGSTKIDHIYF